MEQQEGNSTLAQPENQDSNVAKKDLSLNNNVPVVFDSPTTNWDQTPGIDNSHKMTSKANNSSESESNDKESDSKNGAASTNGFISHPVVNTFGSTLSVANAGVAAVVAAMEFDEYESLPSTGVAVHFGAGAVAGIMEHCVMYPMDSVKTRMQSLQPAPGAAYSNVYQAFKRIIRQEGIFRPMRGMSIVVLGAGPAHALYFACYEKMKVVLASNAPSHYNHLAYGLAGCLATVFHDGVMTPADVVKQRMQMFNSPYKNCSQCVRQLYKQDGARAFYRSYTTQLTMNVPFQSLHFMVYELMQGYTNRERSYNPKAHVISGAIAGGFAAAVTTPLDVCKTLLNTQEATAVNTTGQSHITGLSQAFRTVYRLGGIKGYFQGASARVLYQMPSTAICWSTYEFFKYILQKE